MSRNVLHVRHFEEFKAWLSLGGIEHRPGRGEYQLLQIKDKRGRWQCVFNRPSAKEHLTIAGPIEGLAGKFIRSRKNKP